MNSLLLLLLQIHFSLSVLSIFAVKKINLNSNSEATRKPQRDYTPELMAPEPFLNVVVSLSQRPLENNSSPCSPLIFRLKIVIKFNFTLVCVAIVSLSASDRSMVLRAFFFIPRNEREEKLLPSSGSS
jgi:predicted permease